MRMITAVAASAVATSLVVLSACSGHSSKHAAPDPAVPQLEGKALVVTDLPSVYSVAPSDPLSGATHISGCGSAASLDAKNRLATTAVAYSGTPPANDIHEVVGSYRPGAAHQVIVNAMALPRNCAQFTTSQGGITTKETISVLPFTGLLDETFALNVVGQSGSYKLSFDEVFIRKGDLLIEVVHGGIGDVDQSLTRQLATKAAAKL
jgi:hypothetical protein